ncbi:hypothetical protein CRUP_031898 [Coryphaenoides rupestris]|nr:hypothetical protein CRUP_031898 [Coryphaenoides rupestris]
MPMLRVVLRRYTHATGGDALLHPRYGWCCAATPTLRAVLRRHAHTEAVNGDTPPADSLSEKDRHEKSPVVSDSPQSGPQSGLRQTPRPRTIYQAGLTGQTPNKPRRALAKTHTQERGPVMVCMPIPETPGPELMEADSKDSAQSTATTTTTTSSGSSSSLDGPQVEYKDNKGFGVGELVWGKIKGFSWWPGMVVTWRATSKRQATAGMRWLHQSSYAKLASYRRAIFQALEMASIRAEQPFPACSSDNPEDQVRPMLDWANGGFMPKGEEGLRPTHNAESKLLNPQVLDVSLPEYFPSTKKPRMSLCKSKSAPEESYSREQMVIEVLKNKQSIEEFCLSCGKTTAVTFHPLFEGGLCQACKDVYLEISYMYDDDGYQSYCTVCCGGREVLLYTEPADGRSMSPLLLLLLGGLWTGKANWKGRNVSIRLSACLSVCFSNTEPSVCGRQGPASSDLLYNGLTCLQTAVAI